MKRRPRRSARGVLQRELLQPGHDHTYAVCGPGLAAARLNLWTWPSIGGTSLARTAPYRGKSGNGVRVERMVAEGIFFRFLPPFVHNVRARRLVLQTYAAHLLRARIGYSAGLSTTFQGPDRDRAAGALRLRLAAYSRQCRHLHQAAIQVRNATPNEATGTAR